MVDTTVITNLVLGSMNATATTNGYTIYGMTVATNSVTTAIEMARRNLYSLVGDSAYNSPQNEEKFESYITDMACMRLAINMLGIAVPTHFNYKTTDLSVSKNVNPSLEEMIRDYEKSINQWLRLILNEHWTGVGLQDDLALVKIIEYNGVNYIGRDADSMQTNSRR
jgi:hypothetical protein